jgi:hypothetical protein
MPHSADLAIRLRRAAFNQALAEADLAAIGPILSPNAILITGTDSAVLSGRKAQLIAWKREFSAARKTIYSRIPNAIEASPVEPIALEHGHWRGVFASDEQLVSSGTYCGKWRKVGSSWVIEAEIYLTLV